MASRGRTSSPVPGSPAARAGELVVVGTGIKLVGQTTLEAVDCITRADRLIYLVTDPATETWLHRLNPAAESLIDCYAPGQPREQSYRAMVRRILAPVRGGSYVCAAFYGHPGVFVNPGHQAVRGARREGFRARMLPGISTEDCLFADLGLDPATHGCQSFEATDFLAYRRRFDPTSALILWQVGVLGESSFPTKAGCRPERLERLAKVLRRHYDERHPVILYEAAQFPVSEPKITRIPLSKLPRTRLWSITTLYIPPKPSRVPDRAVMRWFDED